MSLKWIVPGRRAVVTERISYRDVIAAWVEALREDELRRTLLDWYEPLAANPSQMARTRAACPSSCARSTPGGPSSCASTPCAGS